jgi:hypothetical protein
MKPAIVVAKLTTCAAVAGAVGVSTKCFPPAPVATTNTRSDEAQTQFWYLQNVRKMLRLFPIERNVHQLRTLSPQKDTYSQKQSGTVKI